MTISKILVVIRFYRFVK